MELVNYLRKNTVETLKSKFHMKVKVDSEYPQLMLFHYDQIKSPKLDPVIIVSRGIILDSSDNWKIISYPYDRFFNYSESGASDINTATMKIQEKLDGSLLTLYNYKGIWRVSTSGMTNASGRTKSGITFSVLFDSIWDQLNYPDKSVLNPSYCYMFELCSNDNTIVIQHPVDRLVLHGVRDLLTLKEVDPYIIGNQHGFEVPRTFDTMNISELVDYVETLKDIEGFVVVDEQYNRLKMKASKYLSLHHTATARPGINLYESIIKVIQKYEGDEWLSKFPQHIPIYNQFNTKFIELLDILGDSYGRIEMKNQKSYALSIKDHKYKRFLFDMRRNNMLPEEYLRSVDAKELINYLV